MKGYNIIIGTIIFCLSMASTAAIAQSEKYKLTGTVVEPIYNEPVAGAVISVTGLTRSVTTDKNGEFSVLLNNNEGEVSVWSPGYYTNVQPIEKRTNIHFVMMRDDKLNYAEIMTVPFKGSIPEREKQTSLTSIAKSSITMNKNSVDQTFLNIPGLQVIQKSGMPGEGSFFSLRGVNTITSNSQPLLVVNGVPYMPDAQESGVIGGYSKDILGGLDAHDIENITVLKGADAAMYGSLGSNGVIMIETDKAVDLDTKVEFYGQYGIDWNQSTLPVLDVDNYKKYITSVAMTKYDDMANILSTFPYLSDDNDYYYKYLYNNNTNWQNEIYKPSFSTNNILKIKGGDAIAKYDFSLGYSKRGGQVEGTNSDKYYARLNSDVNLSRKVSLFSTLQMAYIQNSLQEQGLLEGTNPLLAALKKGPLFSPYEKDADNNLLPDYAVIRDGSGNLITNNSVSNPLAIVKTVNMEDRIYDVLLTTGMKYEINKDWTTRIVGGLYYNHATEKGFIPGVSNQTIMPSSDSIAENTSRVAQKEVLNLYISGDAVYQHSFGLHQLRAAFGGQATVNSTEYNASKGVNTSSDYYKTLYYTSSSGGRSIYGYTDKLNWMNFHAAANYNYNHLLGAGLTLSYDGASSVGEDAARFRLYPAVNGVAYLKNLPGLNNMDWLNALNVRAEYSITGNSRYSSTLSKYSYVNKIFRSVSGVVRAGIPNTGLKPELNKTLNIGLDFSAWNHRFDLNLDIYHTINSDLILPKSSSSAYGTNYIYDNAAKAKNDGIELSAQIALIQTKNWRWYVGGSISHNKDKVTSLGGQDNTVITNEDGSAVVTAVGGHVYEFYGYKTAGIFSTSDEATKAGLTSYNGESFEAGDVHFVDQNGDGVIDNNDRVSLGSANPSYYGTFFTELQYKDFKLNATFSYSHGNKMYNALRRNMEAMSGFTNQLNSVNRRWFEEGQETDMPRAAYGDPMGNNRFSDRYIEDASYLKLKEIMLSYSFKFMGGTTVYVSGENLWTATKYLGLDPETSYSYDASLRGFDYGKIPSARSLKVGFKIQF